MQLNYSSESAFLPSIVNVPEMALELDANMSKVKKKLQREIIKKVSKLELSIL